MHLPALPFTSFFRPVTFELKTDAAAGSGRRHLSHCGHLLADRDWGAPAYPPAGSVASQAGLCNPPLLWNSACHGERTGSLP